MFLFYLLLFIQTPYKKPFTNKVNHGKYNNKSLKKYYHIKNLQNNNEDYVIPKWVYKKVFKYNRPTKFRESDYLFIDRVKPKKKKLVSN